MKDSFSYMDNFDINLFREEILISVIHDVLANKFIQPYKRNSTYNYELSETCYRVSSEEVHLIKSVHKQLMTNPTIRILYMGCAGGNTYPTLIKCLARNYERFI